jgi:hypothetical protein
MSIQAFLQGLFSWKTSGMDCYLVTLRFVVSKLSLEK